MANLSGCKAGDHDLQDIYTGRPNSDAIDSVEVVRWCSICGSIVVDVDSDNRTAPGYVMKMRTPQVAKEG